MSTSFFFLLPAISLTFDPEGRLCWFICSSYLYLHLFKKEYVYYFHTFDKIDHYCNNLLEL